MILYSDKLSREQVEALAKSHGMEAYGATDFYGPRRRRMSFVLRPTDDMDERYRVHRREGQRVWAVTWEGHYLIMSEIFDLDPAAEISSSLERWRNRADFRKRAEKRATQYGSGTLNKSTF